MEEAEPHLRKARMICSELMTDVRQIVGALRESEGIDLANALHELTENLPGLAVNLSMPDKDSQKSRLQHLGEIGSSRSRPGRASGD